MNEAKRRKNKPRSIFSKLMISYVVFTILAIVGLILCMIVSLLHVTGLSKNSIFPGIMVNQQGVIENLREIENLGGWVELLDTNLQIEKVYGNKKVEQTSYTLEELIKATSLAKDSTNFGKDYHIHWQQDPTGFYVIYYPKEVYQIVYNFNIGSAFTTSVGKGSFIAMCLILLLDIIGVSLYLSHRIRKPLGKLIQGMQSISTEGPEKLISMKTEKEFIEISDVFNHMVVGLQEQKKENELLRRNRNRMLLELSHDIKTPVATIKSSALALKEGMVEDGDLMKYYQTIVTKADRVNDLSNDLFTMLKVESDDYVLQLNKLNITELLRQVCASQYLEITDKCYDFEINIPEESIYIHGDKKLLIRVIDNLLINSRKYNLTGSKIGVSLTHDDNTISLVVYDDGEEIPIHIQNTMFMAFARGEDHRSSNAGSGLGLAIAHSIVKKHKGTLEYIHKDGLNQFILQLR